jgi:carbon-monoxide dehydrogenase small subunit
MKKIRVKLNVNGKNHILNVPSNKTLLEVLREYLGLTGTKEGCGEGECGACVVIMNGMAVNSCLVLVGQAGNSKIITIEGLEAKGELHHLQEAFIKAGAVQCGFCTPGMIMSAKALLDKIPNPKEEEIRSAISGNLCRCTGYAKITKAIKLASSRINNEQI